MRYMIVERFAEGRVGDVYRRLAESGRMLPTGLRCIDSWVSADLRVCYQLMDTDDPRLIGDWTRHWSDVIQFEIVPVISSAEARAQALARE